MRKKHASEQDEAEINLAPMLDIVFIMLIFFIVTATFVKEEGIRVSKPQEAPVDPQNQDKKKNVQMRITEDCWVIFGTEDRRVSPDQVGPNVQRLLAERPDAPVIISIEGEAKSECVVEVMDQVVSVGVSGDSGRLTLRKQEVAQQ